MTADILRAAADRLDELAGAATRGPGVWRVEREPGRRVLVIENDMVLIASEVDQEADAAYIAAMHPEVGKALAAWLRTFADRGCEIADTLAGNSSARAETICRTTIDGWNEAHSVARLILGGA